MSDDTGEFFPFQDEGEDERENPPRRTRKGDATGDETRAMPATDDGGTPPADGDQAATTVYRAVRESEATTVYRPAAGNDPWDDEDPIWAGRAEVRAAGPAAGTEWSPAPPEEPGGRWLRPVLVTLAAMLLAGMLGWGIYLIVQNSSDDEPESPAPVVTVPAAVPSATTRPASAPPSTVPTSATPSSAPASTPSDVAIPALRGLSLDEARAALNRTGLNYRLRFVTTTEAPPDTVIGSDPVEGTQVPADTIINLILADEPAATTPVPAAPSPEPSAGGLDQEPDQD